MARHPALNLHMDLAPNIIVRPARAGDVETLVSFSAAMAMETEGRRLDTDRLRQGTLSLLTSPAYGFFQVAEAVGPGLTRLIAQLMVTYEWSDWRNGVFWWMQSVYVEPAWRRQGVFRRMHDTLLEMAKDRSDVCGVRLYVAQDNRIAESAYRRVGLEPSSYVVYERDFRLGHREPLEDRPHEA